MSFFAHRYAELDSFHVEVVNQLSMAQAENVAHRKRNDEIIQQLNKTIREQAHLQEQYALAAADLKKAMRDIHELESQLIKVKQQRDDANKECNNAMDGRNKAIRERQRMYEERNVALREYNLIMSERDSVHKEIEKLQEDLQELQRRNETLEKEYKATLEELESLRRELASALLDRDRAMKTCNDLREKYNDHHSYQLLLPHSPATNASSLSQSSLSREEVAGSVVIGSGSDAGTVAVAAGSSTGSLFSSHLAAQSPPSAAGGWKSLLKGGSSIVAAASSTSSVSTSPPSGSQSTPTPRPNEAAASEHSLSVTSLVTGGTAAAAPTQPANSAAEVEMLRKQIEKLQLDLSDAYQEIEVGRCDS